jgi:hypothetical protein
VAQDDNKLRGKKRFRIAFYAIIFAKSVLPVLAGLCYHGEHYLTNYGKEVV